MYSTILHGLFRGQEHMLDAVGLCGTEEGEEEEEGGEGGGEAEGASAPTGPPSRASKEVQWGTEEGMC